MKQILALSVSLFLATAIGKAEAGSDGSMTFYLAASGGNCVTCQWVAAKGEIEADTADKFIAFLAEEDLLEARGIDIHLNSDGGSLIGGILLGQAIREQQANTVVSGAHVKSVYDSGLRLIDFERPTSARCLSACVFAFAGGVSRFASTTTPGAAIGFQEVGPLGVHQFYDANALADPSAAIHDAEDRIFDQKVISLLLGFLSQMGVSAELLQLAAGTDPRDMHYLSEDELRKTGIDNRMVQDIELKGYPNGVAIVEINYGRQDGEIRHEIYCDQGAMHMLTSIDWRGRYDIDGHHRWKLFKDVSLRDGGAVRLVSENFEHREDGGVTGKLGFRFSDQLPELIERKRFAFTDGSSRYASNSAASMSFTLPESFGGLYLLPRTCM